MSDFTESLIAAVFEKKAIWDMRDKHHDNRYILDELWEQVGSEVSITPKDAQNKWKTLRDKFCEELKKQPKPRGGGGAGKKQTAKKGSADNEDSRSNWQYFNSLLFLTDQFKSRKSCVDLDTCLEDPDDIQVLEEIRYSPPTPPQKPVYPSSSKESKKSPRVPDKHTDKSNNDKRQSKSNESSEYKKPDTEEKNMPKTDLDKKEDEMLVFFRTLLPHINKLQDPQRMLLQIDIQQAVFRYVYSETQAPVSTSTGTAPASQPYQPARTLNYPGPGYPPLASSWSPGAPGESTAFQRVPARDYSQYPQTPEQERITPSLYHSISRL